MSKRVFWTNKLNEWPKVIPPEVWLTDLNIDEGVGRGNRVTRSLIIKGVAYHQDPVQQVTIVTNFISSLKENQFFAQGFSEIKMENMVSKQLNGMPVKNFTISCKK